MYTNLMNEKKEVWIMRKDYESPKVDIIYLMMEEERVDYQPKNRWQMLKAEFSEDETNLDYKAYCVRFFLDEELELGENQMEMCRFYLREGSALRDSYKNFADMSTEYDTVNLICATVAGIGEKTLHPVVKKFGMRKRRRLLILLFLI